MATKDKLQLIRLTLIIHDVDTSITQADIEEAIQHIMGIVSFEFHEGKPYNNDGTLVRKVYLNFENERKLNELMKIGSIKVYNKSFRISRYNPRDIPLSGNMTQFLLIKISEKNNQKKTLKDLTESNINEYFGRFGKIINFQWNDEHEAILKFQHYDIVDQIILTNLSHEINGIIIDVVKTRNIQTSNIIRSTGIPFCIHVTNIPPDVTGEELSQIFNKPVANIVIKPGFRRYESLASDKSVDSEAWINNIGDERQARNLANKNSNKTLHGFQIKCDVTSEPIYPFELCRNYRTGLCNYEIKCFFKHIMCNQPENCPDEQCPYGHSRKRQVTSNIEDDDEECKSNFYRLRISNLPITANKEGLVKLLKVKDEHISRIILNEGQDKNSSSTVAYLIHQRSVKYLQSLICRLHDKYYSNSVPNKMKCQVEINADLLKRGDKCDSDECFSTTDYNQSKKSKSPRRCELDTEELNHNSSEEDSHMKESNEMHSK
ncbi:unnamed protein product, partial [Rotaria sp. Silwood1]